MLMQSSFPAVSGPQWATGLVSRLELTPRGRAVRIILAEPVDVPFADLFSRVCPVWFDPANELLPANAPHAGRVRVLRDTPDGIRAKDIRVGDTVEIGVGIRWQPVARGPILALRPGWAEPFRFSREVRHA